LFSLALTIAIPLLIALIESNRAKLNLKDDGWWTLGRALLGGVHIKWNPDPTPVVWFEVADRQARVHTYQRAGEPGWWIEARVYLGAPLHFAARLTSPASEPLQPSLPGFVSYEPSKENESIQEDLKSFGIETNDRKRLELCLLVGDFRGVLASLKSGLDMKSCEVFILNQVVVVRGHTVKDKWGGDVIERYGPQLAEALRALTGPLLNMISKGRQQRLAQGECPVTSTNLREERWRCELCETTMHRTAAEILRGCSDPFCERCADGVKRNVMLASRSVKAKRLVAVQALPELNHQLSLVQPQSEEEVQQASVSFDFPTAMGSVVEVETPFKAR